MANMLRALNEFPKPVVARVQGAALGGGVGLVACADIVIAADDAKFALSEVKLGLIPATISPFVIAAIGEHQSRRYMLSGERFDAEEARRIGLVHEVVAASGLDDVVDDMVGGCRIQSDGLRKRCDCLVGIPHDEERSPKVPVAVRNIWIEGDATSKHSDTFFLLPQLN